MTAIARVLALASMVASAVAAHAQEDTQPYTASVWARVLFGTDGKPVEHAVVDAEKYPAKFVENVLARVVRARIPPPEIDGKAAQLRTPVELRFLVTPTASGATFRLEGIAMGAMPTRRYYASYPQDIKATGGWQGQATGVCKVSPQGRCASITVQSLPGMPDSVRRHVRASLERWEFEPQRINDQPIEGEYTVDVNYTSDDSSPENFREDKFLRVLRSR